MNKLIAFAERLARCPLCEKVTECDPECELEKNRYQSRDVLMRYGLMLEAREALKAEKVTDHTERAAVEIPLKR